MNAAAVVTDSKQFWQGMKRAAEARNIDVTHITVDRLAVLSAEEVPSVIAVDHIDHTAEDIIESFAIEFPETLIIMSADIIESSFLNSVVYLTIPRTINFSFIMDIVFNAMTYQHLLSSRDRTPTGETHDALDSRRHKNLLIARNGELIIQRERLRAEKQRLENGLDELISSILTMIGYTNPALQNHMRYVAKLTEQMAKGLGLGAIEARMLRRAALLHDIGRTEGEGDVDRRHPVTGENLIAHVSGLAHIATIVRHHHERFDGKGFPDRLRGSEIPLQSRIIAICNHIANLTDNGRNMDIKEIVTSLSGRSGKDFDPMLVRTMTAEITRNTMEVEENRQLLPPSLLEPGMKVAEDIYTSHGLFLLPAGATLDESTITRIRNFHNIAPVPGGVEVFRENAGEVEKAA